MQLLRPRRGVTYGGGLLGFQIRYQGLFRAPPAYTAQLVTLYQHRANNQYRTANQIYVAEFKG